MLRPLVVLTLVSLCAPARAERFTVLHVDEAAKLIQAGAAVFDANVESTRTFVGIVPGARLIDAPSEYPVDKVLPADKQAQLVFYCANTWCTASHAAAERAIDAGWRRVGVLVDGIYGWRKAGQPLVKLKAPPVAMPPREVQAQQAAGKVVVVDVREGEERHEVVDGALWMPMSKIEDPKAWRAFVRTLPADKTVVFYCAVGARSKRSAQLARLEGLAAAWFDGPDQWRAAGLPLKAGPAR